MSHRADDTTVFSQKSPAHAKLLEELQLRPTADAVLNVYEGGKLHLRCGLAARYYDAALPDVERAIEALGLTWQRREFSRQVYLRAGDLLAALLDGEPAGEPAPAPARQWVEVKVTNARALHTKGERRWCNGWHYWQARQDGHLIIADPDARHAETISFATARRALVQIQKRGRPAQAGPALAAKLDALCTALLVEV